MRLWRKLTSSFGRPRAAADGAPALLFHVRCQACGEIIRVRINPQWDLAPVWDEPPLAHRLDKEVRGVGCPRLMMIHVTFDGQYAIRSQDAEGATFATAEEYQAAATSATSARPSSPLAGPSP